MSQNVSQLCQLPIAPICSHALHCNNAVDRTWHALLALPHQLKDRSERAALVLVNELMDVLSMQIVRTRTACATEIPDAMVSTGSSPLHYELSLEAIRHIKAEWKDSCHI